MPCQLCDGPDGPLCDECESFIMRSRLDRPIPLRLASWIDARDETPTSEEEELIA
jgi:hypothetical protein